MVRKLLFISTVLSALMVALMPGHALADRAKLLDAVRSGEAVAMMRHALAPGTGDPENFDVNDCNTQRNLSDAGRNQARAIGRMLAEAGIDDARVLTSQWCRCRETAELLEIGSVEEMPALNSFFQNRANRDPQTADLVNRLNEWSANKPLVLVTHQVNITALTGIFPRSGETVVFRMNGSEAEVLGTIEFPVP